MNDKDLKDWNFEELRKYCLTRLSDGLITGGFKGMNSELWEVLTTTMTWRDSQVEKSKEESKKAKGKR